MGKMIAISLLLIAVVIGYGITHPQPVKPANEPATRWNGFPPAVWHDEERGVTCYMLSGHGSISCVPDKFLFQP